MDNFKGPKETLDGFYKTNPKKAQVKSKRLLIPVIALTVSLLLAMFVFFSNSIEVIKPITSEDIMRTSRVFLPGMHFVKKYPFMIKVDINTVKIGFDYKLYWKLYEKPSVCIPQHYIGTVIEDGKSIKVIPPGRYYINTLQYEVRLIEPGEE